MSQAGITNVSSQVGVVDSVTGSNGVTATPTTGNVVVYGVNATTSTVGVASFNPAEFTVSMAGEVSLISSIIGSPENNVYVAKNGNDTTGDGSFTNPYLTIAKAVSTVSPGSIDSAVNVIIAPGFYTETAVAFKPWVNLVGGGSKATILDIPAPNFTPSASFLSATSATVSFSNLAFNDDIVWDFTTGSGSGTPYVILDNVTLVDISISNSNGSYQPNIIFNYVSVSGNYASTAHIILLAYNSQFNSAVQLSNGINQLSACVINHFTLSGSAIVVLYNSVVQSTSSISGIGVGVQTDADSWFAYSFLSGATIAQVNLVTPSNAIATNYSPVNFTPTNNSVEGAIEGIDNALGANNFVWHAVAGTSQAMAVNNGYYTKNGSPTSLSLPATAAAGSIMRVTGTAAGLWTITQGTGQTIRFGFGSNITTPGAAGSLASTQIGDSVELLCITANTEFQVVSSTGNLSIT